MQEVRLQSGQSQLINNCTYCQIQMFVYKQIIQTTVCLHHVDMHLFVNNAVHLFVNSVAHLFVDNVVHLFVNNAVYLFTSS